MGEWFEQWFGEEYLRLYPHRDEEDAARAARMVDAAVPLAGRRVLDLACGPGRHVPPLADRRARIVGLDLSGPLLRRARATLGGGARLVRGDMRALPFRGGAFDLVVNLFTSFGYFSTDDAHTVALAEMHRVLRPGGHLVLDYFNAEHVTATLVPAERRQAGEQTVDIRRRITDDGRYVVKEMHLVDEDRTYLERVRLFTPDDLTAMLCGLGFAVQARLGDYGGAPLGGDSPRAILVAERQT